MDFQSIVSNAVSAQRGERLKSSDQWSIGELIQRLEPSLRTYVSYDKKEEPRVVVFNFEYLHPSGFSSWRGSYEELAIEFDSEGNPPTVEQFLSDLKDCVGKEFTGYKGGEFVMGRTTPLWVANYGNSGNTGIVGVREDKYQVTLLTEYCKF